MKGRICCIDFGLKRIGIALSNENHTIATKHICLENKGFKTTSEYLSTLIKEKNITSFVIGWPLTPNGDESTQCKLVDNFCNKLLEKFQLNIVKYDERNSTKICENFLKKSKITDDIVAAFLLQNYLDENK